MNDSERVEYLLKYWSHRQLAREYEILENKLKEIKEVIKGYMPNEYAMCKAFDEIEFIIEKEVS